MQLVIHGKNVRMDEALNDHITRRLQFAVGRFSNRIDRIQVHLLDVNGPRGGKDICCRLVAHLPPAGELIVEESDLDEFAAVARAAGRLGRRVSRELDRRRRRHGSREAAA